MSGYNKRDRATAQLRRFLINLSRPTKAGLTAGVDFLSLAACAATAFWSPRVLEFPSDPIPWVCIAVAVSSVILVWSIGLYRSIVRFVGLDLLITSLKVSTAATLFGSLLVILFMPEVEFLRWAITYFAFSLIYLCASRFLASVFLVDRERRTLENVIVYGAGSAGAELVATLRGSNKFRAVAMVDDSPPLHGKRVKGLSVFSPARIDELIERHNARRVLLAMPSATRRRRRRILEELAEKTVHVQTIPDVNDIVIGKAKVDEFSDIDVEDLLGRDPVPPKDELLKASIEGKRVMVTGAGGSIGSELCRQILALKPSCLVLLEISEPALYSVNRELVKLKRRNGLNVKLIPLLGSVHHRSRLSAIFKGFNIETIYHAAAYKHVPIVEHNLFEGIHNNVFGTLHTALAAAEHGVERFVLVSTDKAVNPTNVMGATKRTAELILQALQAKFGHTVFCMVRFGNVLESSGSVVPLFREQIKAGGPVTVTHRDIIRYFMTIPEAAQLVIQASAMAQGGDVFVLDMGEPVRINDLAHRMIGLMGMTAADDENPDGDIKIEYIGLRPAEKLYEELLIGADVQGTEHPRILKAEEAMVPWEDLDPLLVALRTASERLDYHSARESLMQLVSEYRPPNDIEDLVCHAATVIPEPEPDTIIDFPKRPA